MNEIHRSLPVPPHTTTTKLEVTDSVLPAEGSLFKLIKRMCPADHFSKTKIEWEKTQLTLSVI